MLIWYIIFCYVPMGGLVIAFKDYSVTWSLLGSAWAGFSNSTELMRLKLFSTTFLNTLIFNGAVKKRSNKTKKDLESERGTNPTL